MHTSKVGGAFMKARFFNHLKTYLMYYCFNFGIMIGGILLGIYYFHLQPENELLTLSETIISILNGNYIQEQTYVLNHFKEAMILISIIYLLSLSVLAIPILPILLFYKSMQLGFSAALYVYAFHFKGIIGILLTLIPYLLFEFIAYYTSFAIAYEVSLSIMITSFIKNQILSFKEVFSHLLNHFIWSLCFILTSILIQIYLLPVFFKLFIS